ncbi:hypothetical protein MRX96_040104 [Rhipicephalus microplus]
MANSTRLRQPIKIRRKENVESSEQARPSHLERYWRAEKQKPAFARCPELSCRPSPPWNRSFINGAGPNLPRRRTRRPNGWRFLAMPICPSRVGQLKAIKTTRTRCEPAATERPGIPIGAVPEASDRLTQLLRHVAPGHHAGHPTLDTSTGPDA